MASVTYSNGPLTLNYADPGASNTWTAMQTFTGGITVSSTAVFNDNVTLGSSGVDTVTVHANAVFNDDVSIVGSALFQIGSDMISSLGGTINFNVSSIVTFSGSFTVASGASANFNNSITTFNNDVTIGSSISDTLTVNATALINNSMTVLGSATMVGDSIQLGNASSDILTIWATPDFRQGTSSSANSGTATLPSKPVGFINVQVAGTNRRIPYYAV